MRVDRLFSDRFKSIGIIVQRQRTAKAILDKTAVDFPDIPASKFKHKMLFLIHEGNIELHNRWNKDPRTPIRG
jgi:hypothetical protein